MYTKNLVGYCFWMEEPCESWIYLKMALESGNLSESRWSPCLNDRIHNTLVKIYSTTYGHDQKRRFIGLVTFNISGMQTFWKRLWAILYRIYIYIGHTVLRDRNEQQRVWPHRNEWPINVLWGIGGPNRKKCNWGTMILNMFLWVLSGKHESRTPTMLENDIEVWYRAIERFYYVFMYHIPTGLLYRKYMSQVVFAYCTLNIHMWKLSWG